MCAVVTGHPLDTIKVRLQTAPPCGPGETPIYKGALDCAHKTIALEGISDVPASGVFFLSYEWIKELLSPTSASGTCHGVAQTLFAGGMAGVLYWLVAIPPDILKSRLQTAPKGKYPKGLRSAFGELLAVEGAFALYKGAAPIMIRSFPANAYLKKLNCPFGLSEPQPMVDWILNRGIESQSSLEFKHGVENLAKLLEIPQHPDPKQSFRAACLLIEKMLSHENIEMSKKEYEKEVDLLKTEDVPLGFDVSDPVLRSVVLTLRLLHVSELRQLQDQINCAIVQVQQITADPKTDEKLGQVGF
ncbi:unnamed protein product [Mesocestoides corti]|uniref:Uncharacterized protein n=2 Tax=Mesocestoides corti TaxID=53468 RepID=A0A158QVR4_MESCO|nr:unnamed protein product [Mesocestoides corti]